MTAAPRYHFPAGTEIVLPGRTLFAVRTGPDGYEFVGSDDGAAITIPFAQLVDELKYPAFGSTRRGRPRVTAFSTSLAATRPQSSCPKISRHKRGFTSAFAAPWYSFATSCAPKQVGQTSPSASVNWTSPRTANSSATRLRQVSAGRFMQSRRLAATAIDGLCTAGGGWSSIWRPIRAWQWTSHRPMRWYRSFIYVATARSGSTTAF